VSMWFILEDQNRSRVQDEELFVLRCCQCLIEDQEQKKTEQQLCNPVLDTEDHTSKGCSRQVEIQQWLHESNSMKYRRE
jgi:hypothetical protein